MKPIRDDIQKRLNDLHPDIEALGRDNRAAELRDASGHFNLPHEAMARRQNAIEALHQHQFQKAHVEIECARWLVADDRRSLDRWKELIALIRAESPETRQIA